MAIRLYMAWQVNNDLAPAFAGWTENNGARYRLTPTRTVDGGLGINVAGGITGANETSMAGQWISDPLAAGNVFSPSVTVKGVVQCGETNVAANIDRQPLCLKVVSADGTTLRATLLSLGHYGPTTTEWPASGYVNRYLADGDALQTNYTTVAGDRLVLEVGAQLSAAGGGSPYWGTMDVGIHTEADLAENESDVGVGTAWFELSNTLTWFTPPDDAGGCLLSVLRRF